MRTIRNAAWPAILLLSACAAETPPADAAAGRPATAAWQRALEAAHHDGGLDYAALKQNRADLDEYLASLALVEPSTMSRHEQLAFWVNAYNAVVAAFVLERYPGLESVRDVDGFFDELRYPVAGEERTLDEIETRGRDLGDARVHFAVVCASTSCPDLRHEAFVSARLEEQLAEQTGDFLGDPSKGLRLDRAEGTLWLSSIFKWYAGDFTGGSTLVAFFARGGVIEWVTANLPAPLAGEIRDLDPSVRYLDYDWSLNDRPRPR